MAFQPYEGVRRSYYLGSKRCPNCQEEVFAAQGATLVPEGIRLEWCCDLCGHRFETAEAADVATAD
jgi:transcriptional regulator NrdR family protein